METAELERRMLPGGWHSRPLLLPGQSLDAVIAEDAGRLRGLGDDAERLGQAIADALAQATGSDWFRPASGAHVEVELRRRRGFITCPWASEETEKCTVGKGGRASANEFLLRDRASGLVLPGFEIMAHLIRDHAFFAGPGTPFRIEPEALCRILGRHGTAPR